MKKQLIAIALSALLCGSAMTIQGQTTPTDLNPNTNAVEFIVACGSSSGTYEQLLDQLQPFVAESITFKKYPKSTGAIQNLDLLMNNQVQGAFMHGDVPEFRKRSGKDMSKYKTLLVLHMEEVHLLALAQSHRMVKDRSSWNPVAKIPVVFSSLGDLAGYKVGAAGGGFITAQVIKAITLVPYDVVQYQSGGEVIAAIEKGDIDCGLFVGGAPLPNIRDLGPQYKLLSISDTHRKQLEVVYRPTSITYPNMSPEAVNTVAPDCLFMVQDYKSPRFRNALKTLRAKFYAILEDLKETPGDHPKWQEVDPNNHGKWPWLELN